MVLPPRQPFEALVLEDASCCTVDTALGLHILAAAVPPMQGACTAEVFFFFSWTFLYI